MRVSFDNGAHWQSLQLNLPATPVTDIRFARKDLVLSTQGRAFWILDNLTPLHQLSDKVAAASAHLFTPRTAIRMKIPRSGGFGTRVMATYPQAGAQIDYYLASPAAGEISLEILDASGKVVRAFTSDAARSDAPVTAAADDDEEGFRPRPARVRLDKSAGLHRFTWDLRYPGPWLSERMPEGPGGPLAAPGRYAARLKAGAATETQPFSLVEDPRATADGVSQAVLAAQFAHNMKVRDLVSEANRTIARLREAQVKLKGATGADADKLAKLDALAAKLVTPPIRYSKPELLSHITYLYQMTNMADQPVGRDAVERYQVVAKDLGAIVKELNRLLGPIM
jgi:hypothetical protein